MGRKQAKNKMQKIKIVLKRRYLVLNDEKKILENTKDYDEAV